MATKAATKKLLAARRTSLAEDIASLEQSTVPTGEDINGHRMQEGDTLVEEQHNHTMVMNGLLERLAQVQLAEQQLVDGVYGKCVSCGEVISAARLEALPFVSTCVGCASKRR